MLLALLAACQDKQARQPTRANFTAAVVDYLAQRGHVCVAKYDWPIAVTDADRQAHSLDAQQMPVLETLGLVASHEVSASNKGADGTRAAVPAREYALTAEGQKYYLHVPVVVVTPTLHVTHPADFCVAKLSLDRVIGWETPQTINGRTVSSVLFSYVDGNAGCAQRVSDGDACDSQRRHAATAPGHSPDTSRLGGR
jgi:hypothetical protein